MICKPCATHADKKSKREHKDCVGPGCFCQHKSIKEGQIK